MNPERKIRLFRETVMSNSLTENACGTMDLSESGKAIYTPKINCTKIKNKMTIILCKNFRRFENLWKNY